MTFFSALKLFERQIARRTELKVVLAPCPIKDAGPICKVLLRKPLRLKDPVTMGSASIEEATIKLAVSIEGSIESETGLKLALDASEALQNFLKDAKRLEDEDGNPVAGSAISIKSDVNDSVLEDPESGDKAWIEDVFYVDVELP